MNVTGMTCGGCVGKVTRALTAVPDIEHEDVSLPGKASVNFDAKLTPRERLQSAVKDAGCGLAAREAANTRRPTPKLVVAAVCALFIAPWVVAAPNSQIPSFHATALSGEKITDAKLIGQPTILIVTPTKAAAEDTRRWANALRKNLDAKSSIRIRDVLAIDLPFFMSEADAIGPAKKQIPARYYDQTWILDETILETALNIPTESTSAYVVVMDSKGQIIARVNGAPTEQSISEVMSAVQSMK